MIIQPSRNRSARAPRSALCPALELEPDDREAAAGAFLAEAEAPRR